MKSVLFMLTLLLSIPLVAQEDKPIEVPQIAIKLGVAETIQLDGISVSFLEVITDSRCPRNVDCMWAGEAKVKVSIDTGDGDAIEKILVFNNGMSVIAGLFENKELQFLKLTPYPDANIMVADRAPYALLMRAVGD